MLPKRKNTARKKPALQNLRPSISNASLNYIPDNAVEGFQERIESGVNWTLQEEAARYHKRKCSRNDIPVVSFSEALQNTIKQSVLHGFLEDTNISLIDQWECLLSMVLWDNEKFANDKKNICFNAKNLITDNIFELIKMAVRLNNRSALRKEFTKISVLRLVDAKMTSLDYSLLKFKNLNTLNLCGNFIIDINTKVLPRGLKILELQSNRICDMEKLVENLPETLIYLGLARNFINDESIESLMKLSHICILDLCDNDIYNLDKVLKSLVTLPKLTSLMLAGNPCAVCAAYAKTTITHLPQLKWLDSREIVKTDRTIDPYQSHPNDLRSTYFNFTIYRIMSLPQPPKSEKGTVTSFHVELELPLLDSARRKFLMFRHNESLTEYPQPQNDEESATSITDHVVNVDRIYTVASLDESNIYNPLVPKNSCEIRHYTVYESNKVPWNKIMSFQQPAIRIFCPNLVALRDTFRTVITVKLIYTVCETNKQNKKNKKSAHSLKQPKEHRVTLATVKCALKQPDWGRPAQNFHWDTTLGSDEAIRWDDGDLSVLRYSLAGTKPSKTKPDSEISKQILPENLTCHFGFGIDTIPFEHK